MRRPTAEHGDAQAGVRRPTAEHGDAQAGVIAALRPLYHRAGGWWLLASVDIALEHAVVCPDVVGWRRERCPERPGGTPIVVRPDWICEVREDLVDLEGLERYYQQGIPHYWLVDLRDATLTVLRWSESGWVRALRAERGEVVRAEPFDGLDLHVGTLFGDDPSA